MQLAVVRNPAYGSAGRAKMGRKGGLPSNIVKRYGIGKKAWAVYRKSHPKTRRNPAKRHRKAHTRHRRASTRRRRNPTDHIMSGRRFRPVFRRTRAGGWVNRGRTRALRGRRIARRRGVVGYHRRRRARRNPAMGHGSARHFFSRGHMGSLRDMIPLLRKSDWTMMKNHKMQTVLAAGAGFFVGGLMGQAGGTVAILLTGFGGGVLIRYVLKGRSGGKYSAVAPGFVLGAVVAAAAHVFTTGSLQGHAALGATTRNLKLMAQRIKLRGLAGVGEMSLQGTVGVGQLDQLAANIQKQLALPPSQWKLPGLSGKMGDFRTGRPYSPVTQTGMGAADPQASGWSYSPN